ncbi:XkdQ/YqbQ family protein [Cohnella cholangitidis]|uniref:Phage portal protein n=1 Tax=Cohnella cholangitidis TaxID=2598458 RepID=A0A7G5C184_9BACL|nr:phage portal protein [Cohnella cholangitidis]QMV42968.1 phage portal protein [Cohnella cholangitidis]
MSYEVVFAKKYDISRLVESISLDESLEEIAYRANLRLVVTPDMPVISPGQELRIGGIPFGQSRKENLFNPGVVWECNSTNAGSKHLSITAYEKTIYLAKSEDERLMPANQTATERLKQYAKDWGIPVGNIADTGKKLARSIKRSQTILSMIMGDLKETVDKGGAMYRVRMTERGLELAEIGRNKIVWELEAIQDVTQVRTLEGAITRVKVLGSQQNENWVAEPLAVKSKDTDKYGTLQKLISDSNIKSKKQAEEAAAKMLLGVQETYSVSSLDINTIRAGDRVRLNGLELIVTRISHQLGDPGHMELELAAENKVRRDYLA